MINQILIFIVGENSLTAINEVAMMPAQAAYTIKLPSTMQYQ